MRVKVVFFALFLMGLALGIASSSQAGFLIQQKHTGYYYGLSYDLYIPENTSPKNLPLVVALHGCKQNGELFVAASRLEQKAQEEKFALLTISQNSIYNIDYCWNWFLPVNQTVQNLMGEASTIKMLIQNLADEHNFDRRRLYVAGISSGAAMAANLIFCYPDLFHGAGLHSGVSYHANQSIFDVERVIVQGSAYSNEKLIDLAYNCAKPAPQSLRTKKIFLVHGNQDYRVTMQMTEDLFAQFTGYFEKIFTSELLNWDRREVHQQVPGRYAYKMTELHSRYNNRVSGEASSENGSGIGIRKYIVYGLAHSWSGGDEKYSNTDPNGPDVTSEMLQFWGF